MRILMTTDTIGGVWRFTQELVSGLLEQDCAIAVVSLGGPPTAAQTCWIRQMEHSWRDRFTFTPTDVRLEWMQNNMDAYKGAAFQLCNIAESFGADLLHANQFCFGALPIAIPKVITAHSDVLSWATCCRANPLEPSIWLDRYCSMVTNGLAGATAVVAPTKWMLDALSLNFTLSAMSEIIPNGRCIPAISSPCRQLRAVTAGRLWDEAKNVAMLADFSPAVPLLVVGDTRHEATSAPAMAETKFTGHLCEEELLPLLRESAIYICTSKYEPFGLAPIEAGLCGCAVLANDIPSLREVWADAALYFSDASSLAALLQKLSRDTNFLAASQARSLERARTFTRERMTMAYLTLFQEALIQAEREEMVHVA